jgi:hypothetical protein
VNVPVGDRAGQYVEKIRSMDTLARARATCDFCFSRQFARDLDEHERALRATVEIFTVAVIMTYNNSESTGVHA